MKLFLFDIAGERVYQASASEPPGTGFVEWDLRNQSGSRVAPGVYVFVVQWEDGTGSFTRTGKVAVLP